MELKIEIKTVKGYALDTAKKLKPFILGFRKVKNEVWANKTDDKIFWVVDCPDSRAYMAIARNLTIFDKLVNGILNNRMVMGAARLPPKDMLELKDMLHNQTKIRVVKNAEFYSLSEFEKQESLSGQS
jgi:hypothetical protein